MKLSKNADDAAERDTNSLNVAEYMYVGTAATT
jgi:hypothetical protein